jgi:fructokinase
VKESPAPTVSTTGVATAGLLHHLGTRGLLGGRLTDLRLGDVEAACLFATQVAALTCSVAGPNPPWHDRLAPFSTDKAVVRHLDSTH